MNEMKNIDIKNIIIDSLGKVNDDGKATLKLLHEIDYDFSNDFEDNILTRILNKGKIIQYESYKRLRFAFINVSVAAVGAIILLIISIFIQNGGLSIDSFLGVEDSYSESIVYLLTGN